MKRLTDQNYYQLLEISPKASFEEVRSAYNQAVSVYSIDSVATYSLFTQKEREQILSRFVDAYKTLTNSQLRREYDHSLVEKGELTAQEIGFSSLEDSDTTKDKLREVSIDSLIQKVEETENEAQPSGGNLDLLENLTSISGKSIKMIRMAREISLEQIYRKTNIPKKTLEDIEEEHFEELPAIVYLKGFLRTYAKILNVNQGQMADGYVQRYLEWKNTYQK
jgi:DnaJ-class molecular chaperone